MAVSATYSTYHQQPPVIIQYTVIPEWFILMHVSAELKFEELKLYKITGHEELKLYKITGHEELKLYKITGHTFLLPVQF